MYPVVVSTAGPTPLCQIPEASALGEKQRIAVRASLSEDALFVGRMVIAHGNEFPVLRDTFAAIAFDPIMSRLTAKLRHWTSEGKLACTDPEADALRFFDVVASGWTSRALLGIGPNMPAEFFETEPGNAVSVFLEGRTPRRRER